MKKSCLFIYLCLTVIVGQAQHADLSIISDFALSDYRARFERRPAMVLDGNATYGPLLTTTTLLSPVTPIVGDGLQVMVDFNYRLSSNIDRRIRTYTIQSQPTFNWPEGPTNEILEWENNVTLEQQYYFKPRAFWGQALALGTQWQQEFADEENRATLAPVARADVFIGRGRMERAEDALLAAWLLTDLFESGHLDAPDTMAVFTLARTITDLIGNRTFDLRRRRIYELEQLDATINGLSARYESSIGVFSLLNDNWAFANRALIQHGQEWRFGLGGEQQADISYRGGERQSAFGVNSAIAFLAYRHSKIYGLRHSGDWTLAIQSKLQRNFFRFFTFPFDDEQRELRNSISLNYSYNWFPNSRTQLNWLTTIGYSRWDDVLNGRLFNSTAFFEYQTELQANIFVSYQWALRFQLGISGGYFNATEELSYTPIFLFSSNYNIF